MNLNKILNELQLLNRKHQDIKQRFSCTKGHDYVYKNCLKQDQLQDQRIYGYTHSDTINKFKMRHPASAHQICSTRKITMSFSQNHNIKKQQQKLFVRSQTAHRSPNRHSNKMLESYSQSQYSKKPVSKSNSYLSDKKSLIVDFSNQKQHQMRRKSIAKMKKQFNINFQEDLKNAKIILTQKKIKSSTKTLIIQDKQNKSNIKEKIQLNNIFQLTQNNFVIPSNPKQWQLSQQQNFRVVSKLNLHIFDKFLTYFLANVRKKLGRSWVECWKVIQQIQGYENFKIYLISLSDLKVYIFSSYQLNQIYRNLNQLFKNQKLIHLSILQQGQQSKLLYEEFIVSPRFTIQHFQWHLWVFRYYFKRFMILSQQYATIKQINQSQKIFFINYNKVPKKFYHFIHELKGKQYLFIDQKLNKYCGNLGQFLQEGYKQMELRRMCWIRKPIKFQNQKNRINKQKKQIYFYICSFLQMLKKIYFFNILFYFLFIFSFYQEIYFKVYFFFNLMCFQHHFNLNLYEFIFNFYIKYRISFTQSQIKCYQMKQLIERLHN